MSKAKFDVNETAKKFLSGVPEKTVHPAAAPVTSNKKAFIPESREIGANRPKSVDKETGEVTKQIGLFITDSQNKELQMLAAKMGTNKSAIAREAIRYYFNFLEREGIK